MDVRPLAYPTGPMPWSSPHRRVCSPWSRDAASEPPGSPLTGMTSLAALNPRGVCVDAVVCHERRWLTDVFRCAIGDIEVVGSKLVMRSYDPVSAAENICLDHIT